MLLWKFHPSSTRGIGHDPLGGKAARFCLLQGGQEVVRQMLPGCGPGSESGVGNEAAHGVEAE